jgi:hypothetical protein
LRLKLELHRRPLTFLRNFIELSEQYSLPDTTQTGYPDTGGDIWGAVEGVHEASYFSITTR